MAGAAPARRTTRQASTCCAAQSTATRASFWKKRRLADTLAADAARGQVGDASIVETDAGVGDIHAFAEYRDPDRFNRRRRRPAQIEEQIQVVNHQVEYDIDVEAASGKLRQTMHLNEARRRDEPARDHDRRIVALRMAYRKQRPTAGGGSDECIRVAQ